MAVDVPRILLVDDSVTTLKMQKRMLERCLQAHLMPHVEVDVAKDGRQACDFVQAMSAHGRSYAFITMDLSMPVIDGLVASELIRIHMYHGSSTPIIAISSFDPHQPPLSQRMPEDYVFSEKVSKPLTLSTAEQLVRRFVPGAVKTRPTHMTVTPPYQPALAHPFSPPIDQAPGAGQGAGQGPGSPLPRREGFGDAAAAAPGEGEAPCPAFGGDVVAGQWGIRTLREVLDAASDLPLAKTAHRAVGAGQTHQGQPLKRPCLKTVHEL